jgi:beta-lactamase class A
VDRRQWLATALVAGLAGRGDVWAAGKSKPASLRQIRERIGGRLGVHALDSQSGKRIALDDDSRYAMASTFKLLLATALLWQVDKRAFSLERTLPIARADVLPNSPDVEAKLAANADVMSIRELCAAVVTQSDNAAANVLLKGIGGPAALTSFVRSIGDEVTRMDRFETDLNGNTPGDPRDTTTPRTMVETLLTIFTQDVISVSSRALLIEWMGVSRTGLDRLRAGLPKSWQAGDKTGTGEQGAVNDLLVAYPPERRPVIVAVYMSESKLAVEELAAAHAEIGALVARELGH